MYDLREIDLKSYIPDYLRDIDELSRIANLEEKEMKALYESCLGLWDDGFIMTAGYQGIKKWESFLNIKPDPKLTLDERRAAVLTNWNNQLPYTENKLREVLTALIGNDYDLYVINKSFELKLVIKERPQNVVRSIQRMIRNMIPANLDAGFFSNYQGDYKIPFFYRNAIRIRTEFYPRYNLPHLYLDHIWVLDGSHSLNGYNSGVLIDFYPCRSGFWADAAVPVRLEEQLKIPLNAEGRVAADDNLLRIRLGEKESNLIAERMSFQFVTTKTTGIGPIRVSNRNVMDQKWVLDGSRRLNGGISIL